MKQPRVSSIWDERFLELAQLVAGWSKDPSTKVGAVLIRDRRVVATGYNGFPSGIADDERLHDRDAKYARIVHAEMNALIQAGHAANGATLYMYFPHGGPPCSNCTKHLITAGVVRVVYRSGPSLPRWAQDQDLSEEMFSEAEVEFYER